MSCAEEWLHIASDAERRHPLSAVLSQLLAATNPPSSSLLRVTELGLSCADRVCRTSAQRQPDLVVVSAGLWHMLHITEPEGFQEALKRLKQLSLDFMNAQVCDVCCVPCQSDTTAVLPAGSCRQHVGDLTQLFFDCVIAQVYGLALLLAPALLIMHSMPLIVIRSEDCSSIIGACT